MHASMKMIRRYIQGAPLFLPLVAVAGSIPGGWWLLASVVAIVLPLCCRLFRISICALLFALVAGLHTQLVEQRAERFREDAEWQEVVQLSGTVERILRRGCVLSTGWNGVRVVLRGNTPYTPGDMVQVRAQWREPGPAGVPGVFDSTAWMRGQGIAASLDFIDGEKLGKPISLRTIQYWGLRIRELLSARLMPPGTEQDAARQVLCALVLGDKGAAEPRTMEDFRNGGCLHAFAVSGLHVGLVSGILWFLLRMVRVRPVVIRPLLLVAVGVYVLITGCAVPAIRAYLMLAVLLLGFMLQRRVSLLNTWSFAALVILVSAPSQLYNAGFLLSFGVYAVICVAAFLCQTEKPWFGPDDYIPASLRTSWEIRWGNFEMCLRGMVVVSLSAWLLSVPVTLYFFHSANALSFLTNIAIAPLLPVVMFCGLSHMILGGISWVGMFTDWAAHKSAALLLGIVGWFGDLPYAYLPAQEPASLHSILVQGTGFGGSFTVLGNHGLLVDCGNETTAALKTVPTLFHAGYTPAALLITTPRVSSGGGAHVVRRMWPGIPVINAHELSAEGLSFETQCGRFVLYPPKNRSARKNALDYHPVVLWESPAGRVLYVGNASYPSYAALLQQQADVVISGLNVGAEDAQAARVILLPVADEKSTGTNCVPVEENETLQMEISGSKS